MKLISGISIGLRQVQRPNREPTTILLLKGQSITLTPKDLFYFYITTSFCSYQRSLCLQEMVTNTMTYNRPRCREQVTA